MKVLHTVAVVDDAMSMGGPLVGTQKQILATAALGHDAEMVAMALAPFHKAGSSISSKGIKAHLFRAVRVRKTGVVGLVSLRYAIWLLRRCKDYDLVHVHAGRDTASVWAMICCRLRGVPYVAQTHGMIAPDLSGSRLRQLFDLVIVLPLLRHARVVLALQAKEEAALEGVGVYRNSIRRLRNGVEIPALALGEKVRESLVVCHVNRMSPRKRPEVFIEAAEIVARSGVDAKYIMAGPDDGSLPMVVSAIGSLKHANVEYLGALEHGAALDAISSSDLFVLTSFNEPFPNALMEALAAGVPTVVTESLQMREELEAAEASKVVGHSSEDIASAMKVLLSDTEERRLLGAAGREFAEKYLSMERVAEELVSVYEKAAD